MKTYRATVHRVGDWWAIDIADLPFGHTQAKRLDQAEAMARDLIAGLTDAPEDSFQVQLLTLTPSTLSDVVSEATVARSAAARAEEDAHVATKCAVDAMTSAGLTVRDIGALLGITFQRVQQISKEPSPATRRDRAPVG